MGFQNINKIRKISQFDTHILSDLSCSIYLFDNSFFYGNTTTNSGSRLKEYLKVFENYTSISHSGEMVIGISSKHRCGIDLEKIKKRSLTLLDYVLDHNERRLLAPSFPVKQEMLYAGWTIKEACYKAHSCGYNPSDYKITRLDKSMYRVISGINTFSVATEKINKDYIASIAFKN